MTDTLRNLKLALAGPRRSGAGLLGRTKMQSQDVMKFRNYRDKAGNVYGVEKASNGNWVVIRTNGGGNRKACKQLVSGSPVTTQRLLDDTASVCGWTEVPA